MPFWQIYLKVTGDNKYVAPFSISLRISVKRAYGDTEKNNIAKTKSYIGIIN